MIKIYKVMWVIEVEAATPHDAAREAQRIQRDPDSIANCFTVADDQVAYEIDLDAL